jgi:hypothetical protein
MNRWNVLRVLSAVGCVLSIAAAVWVQLYHPDVLRGYGTFWLGVSAAGALYFVVGYSTFSLGWQQSEEGSIILALVGLLSALATVGLAVRVSVEPPPHPSLPNVIVTIVFGWMMVWLSAIFTRRQVEARRAKQRVSR